MFTFIQLMNIRFSRFSIVYNFCRHVSSSTIYALSSGYGKCGVAVIRVSGPQASVAVVKIGGLKLPLIPRYTFLRKLRDPVTHHVLDKGLVIWFPELCGGEEDMTQNICDLDGPHSFSGEDVCEFQVHGGPAVITAVLDAIGKLRGCRPAEPGEFTKRAFQAGKLDLTEVEGLADLISAETDAQRKQALSQLDGNLSSLYNTWQQVLKNALAHCEAYIDFSEDENIEDGVMSKVGDAVKNLKEELQNHLSDGRRGERLRDGVKAVIVGRPNVGKSSLLNAICRRPAAIVTSVAGTTRDIVEININIDGYPIILSDTAGLRSDTEDIVEKEGILRARMHTSAADLILLVMDAVEYATWVEQRQSVDFVAFTRTYIHNLELDYTLKTSAECGKEFVQVICDGEQLPQARKCITVLNKTDLVSHELYIKPMLEKHQKIIILSCETGDGFPVLMDKLKENLIDLCGVPRSENPCLTRARHRHHLNDCVKCLDQYTELSLLGGDSVLLAFHLRNALRCLGKITGHVSVEDILDVIFKDFCIGK